MKTVLVPALLAASFVAIPQGALAQRPEPQPPTAIVRYGDLNLATPAGVAALDRRIEAAISRVCDMHDPHSLAIASMERHCRTNARFAANSQRNVALASANPGAIQLSGR